MEQAPSDKVRRMGDGWDHAPAMEKKTCRRWAKEWGCNAKRDVAMALDRGNAGATNNNWETQKK